MARDTRMMVKADAKAGGAITAQSTRVAPRWQGSKPSDHTSECISYFEENGKKVNAHIFVGKRKSIANKRAQRRTLNKQAQIRQHLLELAGNNSDAD